MKYQIVYIQHILTCLNNINEYTNDIKQEEFLKNKLIQDAVIRNFEVIGEASKRVSENYKNKHPNIEWKKMTNFRNFLIHEYTEIDYDLVWDIIQNNVTHLIIQLEEIKDMN